jgi:hypothetical protein
MDLQMRTWAVLENDVTRVAIPDNVLGKAVLLLVSWAESLLPRRLLPLARYPMFVISKSPREPAGQHDDSALARDDNRSGRARSDRVRHSAQ